MSRSSHIDRLGEALDGLEDAAADNLARTKEIQRRVRVLRKRIDAGQSVTDLIEAEDQPRIVELLSANMAALETAGAEFRVAQAQALREEGLTIEAVANLFGVTRQRISALLKQRSVGAN